MQVRYHIGLLMLFVVMVSPAFATEVLEVPANGSTVWSSPLQAGETYIIEASGTYIFGGPQPVLGYFYADAEWFEDNYPDPGVKHWLEDWTYGAPPPNNLELSINGTFYDWLGTTDGNTWASHTYNSSHVYRLYYVGTGDPISLNIYDTVYFDNSGSLTVDISPVPEPATLSLIVLGGLAVLRRKR